MVEQISGMTEKNLQAKGIRGGRLGSANCKHDWLKCLEGHSSNTEREAGGWREDLDSFQFCFIQLGV